MADLIKKIKIKKQDGTFTDYIPIGAEAENISVNDGESVELKLNKKPYYYNIINDMKNDIKLKNNDMVITLGYNKINDGGGAKYQIVNGQYIDDNNNIIKLNNNLFALKQNDNIFIDKITYEEKYDTISSTIYYETTIPYIDNKGQKNNWKLGLPYDDTTLTLAQSPISFAKMKGASICINSGIGNPSTHKPHGVLIKDGVILQDELYTANPCKILGIKEDGSFMTFNAATTNAQTVLDAGCINALVGWDTFIENGQSVTFAPSVGSATHPRQAICRKTNGDYLIFTCDGRELNNIGMTVTDMQRILLARGDIDFAYMLDGGGSTSTVIDLVKINHNIDNNGLTDRDVFTFLYMNKNIDNQNDEVKIASLVSDLSQKFTNKLGYGDTPIGNFNLYTPPQSDFGSDLDNIDTAGIYLAGDTTLNKPKDGNFLILHMFNRKANANNKQQFAFPIAGTGGYIYTRRGTDSSAGVYTDWQPVGFYTSTTANRPTEFLRNGQMYFDTTLRKPIWYYNGHWYDANGTDVDASSI